MRERPYKDAKSFRQLSEFSRKKRFKVSDYTVGWRNGKSSKLFGREMLGFGNYIDITVRDFQCSFYEGQKPIGMAEFRSFVFHGYEDMADVIEEADKHTQELYDFADGLYETLGALSGETESFPGMRVIEFKRLAMRPGRPAGEWVGLCNGFVDKMFQNSDFVTNHLLVLCPYPLEYELGPTKPELSEVEMLRMEKRRAALVKHYRKTLGVTLTVDSGNKWWMGKMF